MEGESPWATDSDGANLAPSTREGRRSASYNRRWPLRIQEGVVVLQSYSSLVSDAGMASCRRTHAWCSFEGSDGMEGESPCATE